MRLEIDRWGKISEEEVEIEEIDSENDRSATEYEIKEVRVYPNEGGRGRGRNRRRRWFYVKYEKLLDETMKNDVFISKIWKKFIFRKIFKIHIF